MQLPGVASALVLGDAVRVLVESEGPGPEQLRDALGAQGLATDSARTVPIDMEAAFAFLAERTGGDAA